MKMQLINYLRGRTSLKTISEFLEGEYSFNILVELSKYKNKPVISKKKIESYSGNKT